MSRTNPGAMRNDVRASYKMLRIISNEQWARAQAVGLLRAAQTESAGQSPDYRAARLEQGISGALAYLLGEIRRPDPEPGETRGWHEPHAPGEPCPFHDGVLNR